MTRASTVPFVIRLVAIAIVTASTLPVAAETPDSTQVTLDSVLSRLRARTDAVLSPEAWIADRAFRDSVETAFHESVNEKGLDAYIESHRSRLRFSTGINLDPQRADVRYSKVDGLTLMAPIHWHAVGHRLRLDAGGVVGVAFASEALRYRAGVDVTWGDWSTAVAWQQLAARYAHTDVVGGGWFALFGSDEHQYLHREGFSISLGRSVGRVDVRIGYDRFDERSLDPENPFHISGTTPLHRHNAPVTEGVRRAGFVELALGQSVFSSWSGRARFERSTRGLTYDRIAAEASGRATFPWDDGLHLSARGQAAVGDDAAENGRGVPIQLLADPVGRNGVRGYPQRSRIGTHALFARAELVPARDWLARARVPLADRLRLQPIPFVDVGAAWTPPTSSLDGSTLPDGGDWMWGAGIGIRRNVGMAPVLSHLRIDFAWRLDGKGGRPVTYFVLEAEPF